MYLYDTPLWLILTQFAFRRFIKRLNLRNLPQKPVPAGHLQACLMLDFEEAGIQILI
jgi:hypothetical protein